MKRQYENKTSSHTQYFFGTEVEHSPFHGYKTLFVVGCHSQYDIKSAIGVYSVLGNGEPVDHVYLGANKSFNVDFNFSVVAQLLQDGYLVTLDYPVAHHQLVVEKLGDTYRHSNFTPMISIEFPNINNTNYNTTIKIDDTGFDETNPGVWCHQLHQLQSSDKFTPWRMYKKDTAL
jgi:hypothetical protein